MEHTKIVKVDLDSPRKEYSPMTTHLTHRRTRVTPSEFWTDVERLE